MGEYGGEYGGGYGVNVVVNVVNSNSKCEISQNY